ncbi:hypothetical protein [Lyngbya sp. CCY1209]|uniref:hypothetical protein n=1 Tax=Lyngbya sp. CCY1209 TaxID=2886103 RepID=UPI002D207E00|nr:hypothetical protein [Lyngbya sp. CCY1209]MEB3883437.1 hypothetical protein [Lyngbya sp. CCY1209]
MAIDPISWTFVAAAAISLGAGFSSYWDEIKAWADRVLAQILDTVNQGLEVVTDAVISFTKEKNRYYKQAEVYVMNINTHQVRLERTKEIIELSDIPEEFRQQLEERAKLKIMQMETQ